MKGHIVIGSLLIFMCCSVSVFAVKDKEIPPWMEKVDESGRSTYLIPKGAKRKIVGSQVIVEPPNEYVARRLYEMEGYLENRFKEIEEKQEQFKKLLDELQEGINELEAKSDSANDLEELKKSVEGLNEFKWKMEEGLMGQESAEETDQPDEAAEGPEEILEEDVEAYPED